MLARLICVGLCAGLFSGLMGWLIGVGSKANDKVAALRIAKENGWTRQGRENYAAALKVLHQIINYHDFDPETDPLLRQVNLPLDLDREVRDVLSDSRKERNA